MVVFCEDCGERNIIDPDRIKEENNQYRCSVCNFLNTYIHPLEKKAAETSPKPAPQKRPAPKKESGRKKVSRNKKRFPEKRRTLNTHEEPYSRVFKKISTKKELIGAYVYHFSDGLIAYDIPEDTTEQTLLQIGKAFSVCSPYGHKILEKTKETYLVLDRQVAVCRNITMNSILVIFCPGYPLPPSAAKIVDQSVNNLQVFI